jgi:hypothetical protein
MLSFLGGNANDILTAILLIAVGAILRGIWNIQQRVSRLEGLDEMKERLLSLDREREERPDRPYNQEEW